MDAGEAMSERITVNISRIKMIEYISDNISDMGTLAGIITNLAANNSERSKTMLARKEPILALLKISMTEKEALRACYHILFEDFNNPSAMIYAYYCLVDIEQPKIPDNMSRLEIVNNMIKLNHNMETCNGKPEFKMYCHPSYMLKRIRKINIDNDPEIGMVVEMLELERL